MIFNDVTQPLPSRQFRPNPEQFQTEARLIAQGFGVERLKAAIFTGNPQIDTAEARQIRANTQGQPDAPYMQSWMGTPVYSYVKFLATQDAQFQTPELLIYTCLLRVARDKRIVMTDIAGRDGTAKEYTGNGDYVASMRGVLTSLEQTKQYPRQRLDALQQIWSAPMAVRIESPFLNALGNYDWVVRLRDLPQTAGKIYSQLFELELISDSPLNLNLA